jgi:hypothetical protein
MLHFRGPIIRLKEYIKVVLIHKGNEVMVAEVDTSVK